MNSKDVKINHLYYSTRLEEYGFCVAIAEYLAYMVWRNPDLPAGWYHCVELIEKEIDFSTNS